MASAARRVCPATRRAKVFWLETASVGTRRSRVRCTRGWAHQQTGQTPKGHLRKPERHFWGTSSLTATSPTNILQAPAAENNYLCQPANILPPRADFKMLAFYLTAAHNNHFEQPSRLPAKPTAI